MLLVKVAILGLLRLPSVTVNDVVYTPREAPVTIRGPVRVATPDLTRAYNGNLEITAENGQLHLFLHIPEEDLVAAVVAAESPPNAPAAALEAQAIVARSWLRASRRRHGAFDFCDTTHCQHFKEPSALARRAAARTRGLVLAWNGRPFAPAYSASCGGRTQTAAAIGWRDDPAHYPYFAVECPVCRRAEPAWTRQLSPDDSREIAARPHQEDARLAVGRRSGWDALPSNNYELLPGGIARGRGHGHGLGYCQRGAAGLARQGQSASQILRHYFPGTVIMSTR